MPCGSASGQGPVPPKAGIGLHPAHHGLVLRKRPQTAWLEVHAENFMTRGGMRADLELIARHYPLSIHAVGLSLGSIGLPESEHLARPGQALEQILEVIPHETIGEIHLAGPRIVWDLYARAVRELGPVPTLIEWDTLVPPFETMQEEARIAQSLMDEWC